VEGEYATEIQPLIEELNGLLEDREKAVQRAFAAAGDLAHGLKTPLAVLGQMGADAAVGEQVERMTRQVNYHLARARAAASGTSGAGRCAAGACAEGLVRTMLKLHAGRGLAVGSTIGEECFVRVQREDLEEILGNLLDNACKWAATRVVAGAENTPEGVVLTVDDDGPGLAAGLRTVVLERGVRADEAAPGSGLGLAIVRDLAEVYGGAVSLGESPLGGLRARVVLPGG
jgi:signal transduction histidine kinase